MRILRALFLFFSLVVSHFAFAQAQVGPVENSAHRSVMDDRTLFFWQPHEGHYSFQESFYYYASSFSTFNAAGVHTSSSVQTQTGFTNAAAFGLNETWTLLITAPQYVNTHTDVTPVASAGYPQLDFGFSDPIATIENTTSFGAFKLHFGNAFSVSLSPEKKALPTAAGNKSTGGLTLMPYLGFSYRLNPKNRLGAKLSYEYFGQRIQDDQDGDATLTNGGNTTEATAFYELRGRHLYLQPSFSSTWVDNVESSLNGASSSTSATNSAAETLAVGYYFNPNSVLMLSTTLTQVAITPARPYSTANRYTTSFRYEF